MLATIRGGEGNLGEEDGDDRGDVRSGLLLAEEPLEDRDNLVSSGDNLMGELGDRGDLIGGGGVRLGDETKVFVLVEVTLQGGVLRRGDDLSVGDDALYCSEQAVVTVGGLMEEDVERFVVRNGLNR